MKGIERLEEIIVNGTKLQRSAAAYQLYWNIRDGKGASADKRRSMKYLRVAAENGSVDAMYQMGWHYGTGTFVGKNIVKAIDWYGGFARSCGCDVQSWGYFGGLRWFSKGWHIMDAPCGIAGGRQGTTQSWRVVCERRVRSEEESQACAEMA